MSTARVASASSSRGHSFSWLVVTAAVSTSRSWEARTKYRWISPERAREGGPLPQFGDRRLPRPTGRVVPAADGDKPVLTLIPAPRVLGLAGDLRQQLADGRSGQGELQRVIGIESIRDQINRNGAVQQI